MMTFVSVLCLFIYAVRGIELFCIAIVGVVYVFQYISSAWTETSALVPSVPSAAPSLTQAGVGYSVDIDSPVAVVGAPGYNDGKEVVKVRQ